MYTAAFASGAQPCAASRRAIRIVSGTPAAVVVEEPKLDRMSVRTTPLRVRMSGPFEPSPGNGPAVSSGITVQSAASAADPVAAVEAAALELAAAFPEGVPL